MDKEDGRAIGHLQAREEPNTQTEQPWREADSSCFGPAATKALPARSAVVRPSCRWHSLHCKAILRRGAHLPVDGVGAWPAGPPAGGRVAGQQPQLLGESAGLQAVPKVRHVLLHLHRCQAAAHRPTCSRSLRWQMHTSPPSRPLWWRDPGLCAGCFPRDSEMRPCVEADCVVLHTTFE